MAERAEVGVIHSYPRESKKDHFAARDCPCHPHELPWGDEGVMIVHRRPPEEERRRFKEMFGDRR
jgi:hypothetical protein